jgi:hypothetical protein
MDMVSLIVQLISGAVGGNIAGAALKNASLGPLGILSLAYSGADSAASCSACLAWARRRQVVGWTWHPSFPASSAAGSGAVS